YAKADVEDLLVRVRVVNRGPEAAEIDLLPTLWFRNTWSWADGAPRPRLAATGPATVAAEHPAEGRFTFASDGVPALLFTENETNNERVFGAPNASPYVKDAFHEYVVNGRAAAVNPARVGTKVAAHHHLTIAPGAEAVVRLRLTRGAPTESPFARFDAIF